MAVAVNLTKLADNIRDNLKRERIFRLQVGHDLASAKEAMSHGEFGPWLEAEFSMSIRTAQRYIEYAESVDGLTTKHGIKYDAVSHLASKAVCALAAAPEDIQEAIVAEIKSGAKPSSENVMNHVKAKTDPFEKNPHVVNLPPARIAKIIVSQVEAVPVHVGKIVIPKVEEIPVHVSKIAVLPPGAKFDTKAISAAQKAVALLKTRLTPDELADFEMLFAQAGAAFGETLTGWSSGTAA